MALKTTQDLESDIAGYKKNAEYWRSKGDPGTAQTWENKQKSVTRDGKVIPIG